MSPLNKILISLSVIFALSLGGFIIYKEMQASKRQDAIEQSIIKQKELADNITRSMAEFATRKDMEDFAKQSGVNLDVIKNDLGKLHAEVVAINKVDVVSTGFTGNNIVSTTTTPNTSTPDPTPTVMCDGKAISCPNEDPNGYMKNRQVLSLEERFGPNKVPFGSVGFSAWQKAPWDLTISPRDYKVVTVLGQDENRRHYAYNKVSIKVDGQEHELKITTAEMKEEYPTSRMYWFNPRLIGGIDLGVDVTKLGGEVTPNIGLAISSYGKFKAQPDISILEVGVGYGMVRKIPEVVVTPVAFNLRNLIPLTENTYLGPSLHVGTDGHVIVMAGLRIGF